MRNFDRKVFREIKQTKTTTSAILVTSMHWVEYTLQNFFKWIAHPVRTSDVISVFYGVHVYIYFYFSFLSFCPCQCMYYCTYFAHWFPLFVTPLHKYFSSSALYILNACSLLRKSILECKTKAKDIQKMKI